MRLSMAFITLLCMQASAFCADLSVWDAAYDAQAHTRYIPVQLWTGGNWDGSRELQMQAADLYFGKRKHISGPILYTRPGETTPIQVYERTNGGKTQMFALSSKGDGLGRVYDSRYGRNCIDEVKMPLGLWREGETRTIEIDCNDGAKHRSIVLTIENLDFTFQGIAHSLQFHWLVDGGSEKATDMHYTYSPGKGLVDEHGNE